MFFAPILMTFLLYTLQMIHRKKKSAKKFWEKSSIKPPFSEELCPQVPEVFGLNPSSWLSGITG